ncbi:MAG TPA: MFS transporter [Gammaproteobacteria bacterium]|nr:MFS transporter [Gammaproteobacteria bacterium]
MSRAPSTYWRLSAFYLFYFASLGTLMPYWPLYLQHRGLSAPAIGNLMAVLMATKILAPNIWGWIADHTGRRMVIIRVATALAALSFAGVFAAHGLLGLALVMAAFSFFWNAALPQFEATTMNHLGSQPHRYSMIRLWGSIGFILTVAGVGWALDTSSPALLPPVILALYVGIFAASVLAPADAGPPGRARHASLRDVLRQPEVAALLAVCFLMQASHGPYYTFFTIYLGDHGYTKAVIGQLWALGVVAEIGVFLVMHRWLPRFGPRRLLLASLALTTVRWYLIAEYPAHLAPILAAQTLHAASFGVYHAVAIHLIHEFFTGPHQGRGQALYSSVSFGAGGAVGSMASGYLWSSAGPTWTYLAAAMTSALAWVVAYRGLHARP